MEKIICGIQQVGIGVSDAVQAWRWYRETLGFDTKIFAAEGVAEKMLPYTGGKPQPRFAILAYNLRGGAGFEIWEPKGRDLNYVSFKPMLGDLGIWACKVKSCDIDKAWTGLKEKGVKICGNISRKPDGKRHFFIYDPYGNLFEIEEDNYVFINEKKYTGGGNGAIIGVSDMDRSIRFYSTLTDYDNIVYDKTGIFEDLSDIPGGGFAVRRVLLSRSKPIEGPLCEIMGTSCIELVQRLPEGFDIPVPKKIYEGRFWGDPGFIHLCFDIRNMNAVRYAALSLGHDFVCDGGRDFKMGEADGHFTYVEDPDGTLIEFVETFKIPIMKKWGIYLHINPKNPKKKLPRILTKALRFLKNSK